MSGTSLDGIDVAIVDITGRGWSKRVSTVGWITRAYPASVRKAILAVSDADTHTSAIARLHFLLGELYAEAVLKACARIGVGPETVDLIGCHGQTIFHEGSPTAFLGRRLASTLQIGDGSVLAERAGIPVISDFRPRDIAAGGRGAPLVPYVDYLLFRHRRRGRVALNIGGIANITAIPPGGGPETVIAFDTGPGNMVIDALVQRHSRGRSKFDRGGAIAAAGKVNNRLLDELLRDEYYRRLPPKSAGREQYGERFVQRLLDSGVELKDLITTATVLTAATIAAGIQRFVAPKFEPEEVIASGGGIHNRVLMAYLAAFLPGSRVTTSEEFGVDPDAKEAIAFAVLAYESWGRRPANLPSATGARKAVVLGKLSP